VWPILEKLRKVEALSDNPAATDGEKAAAEAAASRLRTRWSEEDAARKAAAREANPGVMYVLGRAFGRARRHASGEAESAGSKPAGSKPASPSLMYMLGRAVRRTIARW
jgi:hypothetical protein